MKLGKYTLWKKIKNCLYKSYGRDSLHFNKAILGLVLPMCLTGISLVAEASGVPTNITKADAVNAGSVVSKNNVHDIYADKVSLDGKVGLNHFSNFNLAKGDIANMHFHTNVGIVRVENLLNFVDNKINIEGTLNAVRNNKLDGNLYFISSQGMVIGSSGVINAGSLNVITPTQEKYDDLLKNAKNSITFSGKSVLNSVTNGEIPINSQGTIVVKGKVNTTNGIDFKAGSIEIGNEGNKRAALNTGVVNFANLVNIKDSKGNIVVDSGIDSELAIIKENSGNIVLTATGSVGKVTLEGAAEINASGDIKIAAEIVKISADLTAEESIELNAVERLENHRTLNAGKDVFLNSEGSLINSGAINAAKDVALNAGKDLENSGAIAAGGKAVLEAEGKLSNTAAIRAKAAIALTSKIGAIISSGPIISGRNISIISSKGIYLNDVVAEDDIEIKSTDGGISSESLIQSKNSSIVLVASDNISLNNVSANSEVTANSKTGTITYEKIEAPKASLATPAGQVIIDIIFGPDVDEGANNPPYNDPSYLLGYNEYVKDIINAVYDKDKVGDPLVNSKWVYYDRYDLFELEPLQPPGTNEEGATIIVENNDLKLSVAEAAEHKD